MGPGRIELLLPLLLVVGLLLPGEDDVWRQTVEVAVVPTFGWYVWRYGLGDRHSILLLCVPLAWLAWLGASGGWGSAAVRAGWDNRSMAALLTGLFFLAATICLRVTPLPRLEWIAAAFVLASGGHLAVSLARYVLEYGADVQRMSSGGLFSNPNRAAAMAAIMVLFAMYLSGRAGNVAVRVGAVAYVPLAVIYVALTGSRGGLVVLGIAMLAYLVISGGRSATLRFVAVALVALILAVVALHLLPGMEDFAWRNLTRSVYRADIWKETWRLVSERPLLGYGYKYDERILERFVHPHNMHLSNLLYGGVPAFILGVATLAVAASMAFSVPDRQCRALASSAVVFVIVWTIPNGGVPISKPNDDWYHFWIPMALAYGLALRGRGQDPPPP